MRGLLGVWNISLSIMALNLSEVLSEILDLPWLLESVSLTRREPPPRLLIFEEDAALLVVVVMGIIKFETLNGDFVF
jgi:hypothetical protein